jgi:hypothetical protein
VELAWVKSRPEGWKKEGGVKKEGGEERRGGRKKGGKKEGGGRKNIGGVVETDGKNILHYVWRDKVHRT